MGSEEDDSRWSLGVWGVRGKKKDLLSYSLSESRWELLIALWDFLWDPIAVIIHSFDRTLQTVLFKQALRCSTA